MFGDRAVAPALATAFAVSCAVSTAQQSRYRDRVFARTTVYSDVLYGAAVHRYTGQTVPLRLDLYEPTGDAEPLRAALLVVHGGGFWSGSKSEPVIVQLAQDLAQRGYVVASIDYRLRPTRGDVTYQDVVDASHDLKAAVRWLRRFALPLRIDRARVAAVGGSAGAVTALEAAYVPGAGSSGNPGYSSRLAAVVSLWGFLWDESQLDPGEPPVSIVHGTNDPIVPFARAQALRAAAAAAGVGHEFHPMLGQGHAAFAEYLRSYHDDTVAFLWERLWLALRSGLAATAVPGEVRITTFGVAGDFWAPLVAARPAFIPFGRFGVLGLDPSSLRVLSVQRLSGATRLPSSTLRVPVPGPLQPPSVAIQAVHADAAGQLRLLTNAVVTVSP
ncbi:MAG: alpha/beta hydrolase [Planctomycetota bacterium]